MTTTLAAIVLAALTALAPASAQAPTAQEMRDRLEKSLVVGPNMMEQLGVRSLWQQRLAPVADAQAVTGWFRGDSAFVLDSRGGITRLALTDGTVLWRSEVFGPQDKILGVHRAHLEGIDRLFVVADSEFAQLDATSGALVMRKPTKEYLSADCAEAWPYLVLASTTGRLVWFHALLGVIHHQGIVNGAIRGTPQVTGNEVVAAGTSGEIAGFIREDARMLWRRNIGPVFGQLAEDQQGVYAASTNQSIYRLDRQSGKTVWKYFTESAITSNVTLIGDGLLVQVPTEGLICLEAHGQGDLDGERRWAVDAPGEVVGSLGANLLVLDATAEALRVVGMKQGSVVATLPLGALRALVPNTTTDAAGLLAIAADGRVQLLQRLGVTLPDRGLKIIPAATASAAPSDAEAAPSDAATDEP